jgi:hypothetical protein
MCEKETAREGCYYSKASIAVEQAFSLTPLLEQASSYSWLLPNLTRTNWGQLEIQKRHRKKDRQTESGIRCVGHSGGDAQPSLLSLYSLRPYSFTVL